MVTPILLKSSVGFCSAVSILPAPTLCPFFCCKYCCRCCFSCSCSLLFFSSACHLRCSRSCLSLSTASSLDAGNGFLCSLEGFFLSTCSLSLSLLLKESFFTMLAPFLSISFSLLISSSACSHRCSRSRLLSKILSTAGEVFSLSLGAFL